MSSIKITNVTEIPESGPIFRSTTQKSWTIPEVTTYIGNWIFENSFSNVRLDSDGLDYIRVGGRPDGISSLNKSPMCIKEDNDRIYIAQYQGEYLRVYNSTTLNRIEHSIPFDTPIHSLHLDDEYLYVGQSGKDGLRVFNKSSMVEVSHSLSFQSTIHEIISDQNYVYLAHHADGFLSVIDKSDMSKVSSPKLPKFCKGMAQNDDNVFLLLTDELYCLHKHDRTLSKRPISFDVQPSDVQIVHDSTDPNATPENVIDSLSYDTDYISLGMIKPYDLVPMPPNRVANTIDVHDGKLIISSGNNTLIVYDINDDYSHSTYSLFNGLVKSVSFNGNSMFLAIRPHSIRGGDENVIEINTTDFTVVNKHEVDSDLVQIHCAGEFIIIGDVDGDRAFAVGYDFNTEYPIDRFIKPLTKTILIGGSVYYSNRFNIINATNDSNVRSYQSLITDVRSNSSSIYVLLENGTLNILSHGFDEVNTITGVSQFRIDDSHVVVKKTDGETIENWDHMGNSLISQVVHTGRNISDIALNQEYIVISFNDEDGGSYFYDHQFNRLPILEERIDNTSAVYLGNDNIILIADASRNIDFIDTNSWEIIETLRIPTDPKGFYQDGNDYYVGYGQNCQYAVFRAEEIIEPIVLPDVGEVIDSFNYDVDYYDATTPSSTAQFAINTLNYDMDYYNFMLISADSTLDSVNFDVDPYYLSRTALSTLSGVNYDIDYMSYRQSAQQTIDTVNYDVDRYNE